MQTPGPRKSTCPPLYRLITDLESKPKAPVTERPVELPPRRKGLGSCSQQINIVRKRPNTRNY